MTDNTYHLPIEETLKSAWYKVHGAKGTIWIGFVIIAFFMLGTNIVCNLFALMTPKIVPLISFIGNLIVFFLSIGMLLIGIKRAQDLPISYNLIFSIFERYMLLRIIGLYLLNVIIVALPFAISFGLSSLLIGMHIKLVAFLLLTIGSLASIYLSIRLIIAMAFVLDKGVNPWEAIKSSFKVTRCNFWRILIVYVLLELFIVISAIPLGIGLIWTLPFSFIVYGMLYRNLSLNSGI